MFNYPCYSYFSKLNQTKEHAAATSLLNHSTHHHHHHHHHHHQFTQKPTPFSEQFHPIPDQ
ncbi:hypothetical protein Tsubulata_012723, partial [Turnera subulata]